MSDELNSRDLDENFDIDNNQNNHSDVAQLVSNHHYNLEFSKISYREVIYDFFKWIFLSIFLVYLIAIINEIFYFKVDLTANLKLNNSNNLFEAVILFSVVAKMIQILIFFRWNRNKFESAHFDNYPIIIIIVGLFIFDFIYYFFNLIWLGTKCFDVFSMMCHVVVTLSELSFALTVLPFVFVFSCVTPVKSNLKLINNMIIVLFLAILGSLTILVRRISIRIANDIFNQTYSQKTQCADPAIVEVNSNIRSNLQMLEVIDINYFLITFVLLTYSLQVIHNKNRNVKSERNSKTNKVSNISYDLTTLEKISLIRYRIISVLFSILLFTVVTISIMLCIKVFNDKVQQDSKSVVFITFLSIGTFSYAFAVIVSIFYYKSDIKYWKVNTLITRTTSDQYFNFMSSSFQFLYLSFLLVNIFLNYVNHNLTESSWIALSEVLNSLFLYIQIIVQCFIIYVASFKIPEKLTEPDTWKFKLVPSVFLAAVNLSFLLVSCIYDQNAMFYNFLQDESNLSNILLYIGLKDFLIPLTLLHRFFSVAFFIKLTIKQW